MEREYKAIQTRITELDVLLGKLYEKPLLGQIPREKLLEFAEKYRSEKAMLTDKAKALQAQLDAYCIKAEEQQRWLCSVREYMSGTLLDRELLHRLIKVIRVGETTIVDGQKQREVEIIYRF